MSAGFNVAGVHDNGVDAEAFADLFNLDGAVRTIVREELAELVHRLLDSSQDVDDLNLRRGHQPDDGVDIAQLFSLLSSFKQNVDQPPALNHAVGDVDASEKLGVGVGHSDAPCVARAVTRDVAGALVASLRQLQRKAWVRRAAALLRPSDTTTGGDA